MHDGTLLAATVSNRPLTVRPRLCPLCDASTGVEILRHEQWRLLRCDKCGLPYLPEVPSEEAVETDFEWSDSFKREKWERWMRNPLFRAWTLTALMLRPSREARALRKLRRFSPPPGRLLDIGCGDGRVGAAALRAGYDAWGVELSPKMAARAARRMGNDRVLCGRLEDLMAHDSAIPAGAATASPSPTQVEWHGVTRHGSPCESAAALAPGSFDVVMTVSYIEHEHDPLPAMRRVHQLLKPGGICAQKTPNHDSQLRKLRGAKWSGYRWPEHVQYFTPETLGKLMQRAGFEVAGVSANSLGDNFWLFARRTPTARFCR